MRTNLASFLPLLLVLGCKSEQLPPEPVRAPEGHTVLDLRLDNTP